jgi:MoCo/4Fe-4S cofactor protein with predicted Tat translocation signal
MKDSKKVYWKGIEQLANHPDFVKHANNEFAQPGPEEDLGHSRRDFLKMMGFGMAAASLAACEAPIRKAIPYVQKPVDVDPSLPSYYASTYTNGGDYCSIVVKTREGRPIKIEGNALSTVTRGGVNAQVEASVLSLYDNSRLRGPKAAGKRIEWEELDRQIISKLNEIGGGQIRIVSNTILSPSTKAVIERFKAKYPGTQHVQYDQSSHYGMLKANEESFGAAVIPSYDFSKAKTIVAIGCDFLNSWGSTIENTKQYGQSREVGDDKKEMSRHYQFESILTITGANADYRTQIKPSEEGSVAIQLYNLIASKAGRSALSGGVEKPNLAKAADDLWQNKGGGALVVAGSNDKSVQVIVNGINDLLGSYGTTILPGQPVNFRQGNDEAMDTFVTDLKGGRIQGVIFYNCNPVYDHPRGKEIGDSLKGLALAVHTGYKEEETGELTNYLAPDHHFLEAWNDAEPKPGSFSLAQPAITPIFKTRAAQESLLTWAGEQNPDYFEFLQNNWRSRFYNNQAIDFQTFWDKCLYDGVYETGGQQAESGAFNGNLTAAANSVAENAKTAGDWQLVIFENGSVGNGSQANNPLLQELPDPITKSVWDHYVTVSPKDAANISFNESFTKFATITVGNKPSVKVPVLIQPGQAPKTVGLPLGYGRTKAGKVADGIGANAYPLLSLVNGSLSYTATSIKFEINEDESYQIAQTQTHETHMGRKTVIQETTLDKFRDGSFREDHYQPMINTWKDPSHKIDPEKLSIWKNHDYKKHHWGMAIDLNTCTGCGACVVACNVENNVALVGRDEVIRRREMHWLRIDRYYSSDAPVDDWRALEEAADNPEVVFQPMLCQHCNNAPCETVCPVAATTHSSEGINQMTYNRCIGTRYCANNCPYKVRRFNWFKYHDNSQFENTNPHMNTDLGKMVLNPDVTVRSRGVMEKCSFCIQRIQAGKLTAKKERRNVRDGEVVTACAAACSTGAIVFGDFNDAESRVAKLLKIRPLDPERPHINDKESDNPRAYSVLEEINTRPNIFYLTKVRNKGEAKA